MEHRIQHLARVLHPMHKAADVRTLDCMSVVKKSGASEHEHVYGLIYRVAGEVLSTLSAKLDRLQSGNDNRNKDDATRGQFQTAGYAMLCRVSPPAAAAAAPAVAPAAAPAAAAATAAAASVAVVVAAAGQGGASHGPTRGRATRSPRGCRRPPRR
jgi:hypothetical protein